MKYYEVTFQPDNISSRVPEGTILKNVINDAGIDFDFPCGGKGRCGKCRVQIKKGVSEPNEKEIKHLSSLEIKRGIRLACQIKVRDNLTVNLLCAKSVKHQILITSINRSVKIKPHFMKYYIEADKPVITDSRSYLKRLIDSLPNKEQNVSEAAIPLRVLRQLPVVFHSSKFRATAILKDNEIRGIEPGNTAETLLGMAFDIGTTTIVGYLLNLHTGEELNVVSMLNPQVRYGADVISRTLYAIEHKDGLKKLNAAVVDEAINVLIKEGTKNVGVARDELYAVTVVGNSIMQHLFLGINPKSIAIAPYVSIVNSPLEIDQKDINIKINPAGKIFVLPNIGSYVGADIMADILALELDRSDDIKLLIDIGTNGEIVLGNKNRLLACATAAGPAFEGVHISCGMRGDYGAIDHISLQPEIEYSVIGGVKPTGICGSGLLDIVAELVDTGIINKRGKLVPPEENSHKGAQKYKHNIIDNNGSKAFLLVEEKNTGHGLPILLTQQDVRELQLAKGAIAAGIQILMNIMNVTTEQIKEVYLAGAFGNYLNPHSACVIGLIPKELEDKVNMVGNTAGVGSKLALLSRAEFKRTKDISNVADYIELSTHPAFTSTFAKTSYF